ncbi:hypothetical protein GN958_ATG09405, partial [Phytophthora infestans]
HTYKDMPWDSPYRLPTRETETRGTTQEISLRQVIHFKPTATGGHRCCCVHYRCRGHFEVAGVIGVAAATEDMTVLQTLEACLSSLKGGEAATGCRIVRDCQCWCDEIRYREDAGAGGIPPLHEN